MNMRVIFAVLVLYAVSLIACGEQIRSIPADQDLYADLRSGQIYNTEMLICQLDAANDTIPGLVLLQFNLTDQEFTDEDIAILALKASAVHKMGEGPSGIALMPAGSQWSEGGNITEMAGTLEPVKGVIRSGFNSTGVTIRLDDGQWIFTFDVSGAVRTMQGGILSFALVPVNGASYSVEFLSRETGHGPVMFLLSYPGEKIIDEAVMKDPATMTGFGLIAV